MNIDESSLTIKSVCSTPGVQLLHVSGFEGCSIDGKALGISSTSQLVAAGRDNSFHLIFYTIDQVDLNLRH